MTEPWKPTKQQLKDAVGKTVPDLIAPDLDVVFCGINPGLYTAAIGRHFGRPGNRFWKLLHLAGFTPTQLSPFDQQQLLNYKIGVTNMVMRTTATAAELSNTEIREGAEALRRKVLKCKPRALAVLGIQAYRIGFQEPKASVGLQPETIAHDDGEAAIWVLPNTSGLQAGYQFPEMLELFKQLHESLYA